MFAIKSDEFNFYNLTFQDRTTYRHYKEYKECIDAKSSTHTKEFIIGVDCYCLDKLERQFRRDGYNTYSTKGFPKRQFNRETERYDECIYLTVGTSSTIGKY